MVRTTNLGTQAVVTSRPRARPSPDPPGTPGSLPAKDTVWQSAADQEDVDPKKEAQDEEAEPDWSVEQQREEQEAVTREPGGERRGDRAPKAEWTREPASFRQGSYRCESKSRSGPSAGEGSIAAALGMSGRRRHLRAPPQGLLGRRSLRASAQGAGTRSPEAPRKG